MKYLKIVILFPLIAVICGFTSEDWGRTGHRATGAIAEQHLTKKAKRQIGQLLDGKSLALVSTYADEIRSDDAYREYAPWHYVNFPFDLTYDSHPKSEQGDIYVAINTCIAVLKDKNSSKEKKAFHLKLLVHFVGDLHQPLHVGIAEDRGEIVFRYNGLMRGRICIGFGMRNSLKVFRCRILNLPKIQRCFPKSNWKI